MGALAQRLQFTAGRGDALDVLGAAKAFGDFGGELLQGRVDAIAMIVE